MLDYQQRVVDEERELSEKTDKLGAFLDHALYRELTSRERNRLQRQLSYMIAYRAVLRERIEAFK